MTVSSERGRLLRQVCCLAVACGMGSLAFAASLVAQSPTGDLYGTVADLEGAPLHGVTLALNGVGAPRRAVTSEAGAFRFRNLDPGVYSLAARLAGYALLEVPAVPLRAAESVTLDLTMVSAEFEAEIVVTTEIPLFDERHVERGLSLEQADLQNIPTARDPWALLNQVPGVLQDRVNVGGSESDSGFRSQLAGAGTQRIENQYVLDGVVITEMLMGRSISTFDFDQFEEVDVATGGADLSLSTPGVTLSMVTKRGGNDWRVAGYLYATPGGTQSSPGVDPGDFAPGQEIVPTNEIRNLYDYGAQGGGPLLRDRLWAFGSASRNELDLNATSGAPDDSLLQNHSLKLNGQFSPANHLVLWANFNEQSKDAAAAGPDRSSEATIDQSAESRIWKVEDSHVVSSHLFLTGLYARTDAPAALIPRGGIGAGAPEALLDVDGVWRGNTVLQVADLESEQAQLEASYLLSSNAGSHEIDGGLRYYDSLFAFTGGWPGGRDLFNIAGTNLGLPEGPLHVFGLARTEFTGEWTYRSAWIQDTWTRDRWALDFGLRYDRQNGRNHPVSVPASSASPDIFPAIDFPGDDGGGFVWEDPQPRIGLTYALGNRRQTLLRAGWSRFAQQLVGLSTTLRTSPLAVDQDLNLPTAFFLFVDLDGDRRYDDGEPKQFLSAENFDLSNPAVSPNRNDPDLEAQLTDELILAVEHQFAPHLVGGLHLTRREFDRIHDYRILVRDQALGGEVRLATARDYVLDGAATGLLPGGEEYSADYYALREGLTWTGGSLLANGDRSREYRSATLSFNRRLVNRWWARGHVTWSDSEWSLGSDFRHFDDPTDIRGSFDNDGQEVLAWSETQGKRAAMNSSWTLSLSGLYQIAPDRGWGFDLAGSLITREGYPQPYFHSVTASDGLFRNVQVTGSVDDFRLGDIYLLDLRLQKEVPFGDFAATFSVDVFNALNEGTVLEREMNLGGPRGGYLNEALSPRVWRFGVRCSWR